MIRRLLAATPVGRRLSRQRRRLLIEGSDWFDHEFYAAACGGCDGRNPLDHFLAVGEPQGVDPHPEFDTGAYVTANPRAAGAALSHFLRTVAAAGDATLRPADIVDVELPAIAGGWFHPGWYVAAHGLHDLDVHPYVHYVRAGSAAGLSPGPLFDGADYAAHHGLAPGAVDAVSHWLDGQAGPGPVASTLHGPAGGPHELGRHRLLDRASLARLDVCVVVHAFYVDVLPALLAPLRELPGSPPLYVSVVSEGDVGPAGSAIDRALGRRHPRTIEVVPNRGRNFAPLVCTFGDAIRRHELVLHLHTKKSLYTGGEQSDWRDHLVRHLVGNRATVDAVLSRFATDPTTGVVQPPPFDGLPQWANHWLINSGRGRQLLDRLGLDPALGGGYVDYPVGGMFWARADALRPLLDLGLTIDDFEPEAGQTDGTLAHTLERLIGFSALAAGSRLVEVDATTGAWRVGWSTRGIERFGRVGRAELADAVSRADLVSLDLFDTLLLRPSLDPDALRRDAVRRVGPDGIELLRRRVEAEVRARGSVPPEADSTMTEIYTEAVAADPADAARFEALQTEEIEVERRGAVPRRWLIEELRRLKRPSVRYALMTDTYLERPVIDELLERIDAADLFDEVYVSNEVRARKDSGSMWDLVAEREGVEPERWLHLGDNEFSDVQRASDRGIGSIHVPSPGAVAGVAGFRLGAVAAEARDATAIVAGAGVASMLVDRPVRDRRTPAEFGYGVVGPLTFAFVHWLVRRSRADGIDRLLFAARDGWLPLQMLERCRPAFPGGVAPTGYLLTSRRAAFRLSRRPGGGIDDVLDAGAFRGTIGDLVRARLGVEISDPDVAGRHVELPGERAAVIEALTEGLTGVLDEIERLGEVDRPAFDAHLAQLGVGPDDRLGLVDLGYSATAQRALSSVLTQPLTGYYAVTTAAGADTPNVRSCFAERVVWDDEQIVYNSQRVFELVWSASGGQVDHLAFDGAAVVPVTDERTVRPAATRVQVEAVQAEALRFVDDLLERHGAAILEAPLDAAAVSVAIARAAETLVPSPDRVFDGLRLDDHFSGIGELTVVVEDHPS